MRIAINTICMHELSWQQCLAEAAAAGFREVELLAIEGFVHVDPDTADPREILAEARRAGVALSGLHAGGIGGASGEELARSVAYVRKCVGLAAALGVGHLVFTGFPTPEGTDGAARTRIRERLARGLAELEPLVARHRIPIALENHYRCQVETLEDYEAIFAQPGTDSPWLGVTIDTGHFTASGIDPAAVTRALGSRVRNVHVKDHIGTQSVALGRGHTDNAAVVAELRKLGYEGCLTVELEVRDGENALRYVREAHAYMVGLAGAPPPSRSMA